MKTASLRNAVLIGIALLSACAPAQPGPDKQGEGMLQGAVLGAGAGAVTGFQVGAGTGPGAAVGAGFGAVAGSIQGFVRDRTEDSLMALSAETREERRRAIVHEILADQYARRMELHPTREIYPADIFFAGDESRLRKCAVPLVRELANMNRERMPWSRLQIVAYSKSKDTDSVYAGYLAERRAEAIINHFIKAGIEPRRLEAKALIIDAPLLIDPDDYPGRYNQAIEIVPLDR